MFEIVLTTIAWKDLRFFKKSVQKQILQAIEEQLLHQANEESRNRKPLRPNQLAQWEIRVGDFRVFYDVDEAEMKVLVKAVGKKEHNQLLIRGKEYEL